MIGYLRMIQTTFAQSTRRDDVPEFRAGDTVRVQQKIKEGDKERISAFEGLVIARKHGKESGGTFTVRKVIDGVGVERIFPLYSPRLAKIEVIRQANVRRSKLYYIREKAAREIRKKMKYLHNKQEAKEEKKSEEVNKE